MFIFTADYELWAHELMDCIMSYDYSLSQMDILKFIDCFMILFLTVYIFLNILLLLVNNVLILILIIFFLYWNQHVNLYKYKLF
jgi:hypothetical protein